MKQSIENFRIDVDVSRALEVLSSSVFTGRDETIRELIANAADSLAALPSNLSINPEIRIITETKDVTDGVGTLRISDTGIGMTFYEAKERLGKLFSSSKTGMDMAVGRFGIGFYSCLSLCSQVEVLTRTHDPDDRGTRICYQGGEIMEIQQVEVDCPGTTVVLHLLRKHRKLLEEGTLARIIRRYCNYIQFPIYIGTGHDLKNEMDAPWYHTPMREEQVSAALQELFDVNTLIALLPVSDNLDRSGSVFGALFIMPPSKKPSIRLYCQRILITEIDKVLLSEELQSFISGILDVSRLPLVVSRDGVLENSEEVKELHEWLVHIIASGLNKLARSSRSDFDRLMVAHGPLIKAACIKHEILFEKLCNLLPFRSSMRVSVTIPEYLTQREDDVVTYSDDVRIGETLLPIYSQANIEVIYMTDVVDRQLRQIWNKQSGNIEFRRLDVDPPSAYANTITQKRDRIDIATLETVRLLFKSEVGAKLHVEFRPLCHHGPPAVLSVEEGDRQHMEMAEAVRHYKQSGRLNELPSEVRAMVDTGFFEVLSTLADQTIILNEDNDIVRELLIHLKPVSSEGTSPHEKSSSRLGRFSPSNPLNYPQRMPQKDFAPLVARFLYGQALISSGLHLSSEKLTEISQNQTALISGLLQALKQSDQP